MNGLAGELSCAAIELDCLWDRAKPGYATAIKLEELAINLAWAKSWSGIILANGICIRDVMKRLGEPIHFSVYVQRVSRMGVPGDLEALDAEDQEPIDVIQNELDEEVMLYHVNYKPRMNANIVYQRVEE